jgi:DNA-binding NarL/FixJ family response regulator
MAMTKSIRILVANHPKLMREAVFAAFAGQPDVEIVGEVSDEAEIRDRVKQTSPDLLVITLEDSEKALGNLPEVVQSARPSGLPPGRCRTYSRTTAGGHGKDSAFTEDEPL